MFKKNTLQRGFTLIELLVVVAIIGILSSIVLVSLNSARLKGRDASAKGSLSSMRATAEIYYDTHNSYGAAGGAVLTGGTSAASSLSVANATDICEYQEIARLADAVNNQTQNAVVCDVTAAPAGFTVYAQLNDERYYCIDSVGFSGNITGTTPAITGVSCL